MKHKGQVALEFIFIILLIVVYIFSVTKPLIESSQGIIEDIDTITRSNNEATKLFNSVKRVSMLAEGSKETIQLFIPLNGEVGCYNDNTIGFRAKINQRTLNGTPINSPAALCPNNWCDKNFDTSGITIECRYDMPTKGTTKMSISKNSTGIVIEPG